MIYMFLADGFEEIEAITPLDILKRGKIPIKTVGLGKNTVKSSLGISIETDITIEELKETEIDGIVLPGGMPGTLNLSRNKKVTDTIKYCYEKNLLIAAICAAPSILGEMGILKGKTACCYPGFEEKLIGAEVSSLPVCIDDNIITAKGPGVAAEFGFKILEYTKGKRAVKVISSSMQFI